SWKAGVGITTPCVRMDRSATSRRHLRSSFRHSRGRPCNPNQRCRPRWRHDHHCTNNQIGPVRGGRSNTPASEIPYALAMKIREHGKNVYDDAYAKAYKEAPSYYTEAEKIAYAKSKAEEASKVFRQAANDLATTSGRGFVEDALSGKWLKFSPGYGDLKEDLVICFVRGTLLMTDRGEIAVEDLCVGDLVLTRDHGLQ